MKTVTAFANGRVNLIGEHTDYNDGWVFPTAIPQKTNVTLRVREDELVFAKTSSPDHAPVEFALGTEKKSDTWADYIKGATKILRTDGFQIRGSRSTSSRMFLSEAGSRRALRSKFRCSRHSAKPSPSNSAMKNWQRSGNESKTNSSARASASWIKWRVRWRPSVKRCFLIQKL